MTKPVREEPHPLNDEISRITRAELNDEAFMDKVNQTKPEPEFVDNSDKEEWGGWKIVSDMLDNPGELGIYHTSECYRKLYEFVVSQKQKAQASLLERVEGIVKRERNNWRKALASTRYPEKNEIIYAAKVDECGSILAELAKLKEKV